MLSDWIYWLSVKHTDQLMTFLWALLLVDTPRYALSKLAMLLWDCGRDFWCWLFIGPRERTFTYCPTVCVVIAGYNEGFHIEAPLQSVWGSYPRLEIIVVDDGSTDDMYAVAQRFARSHDGVRVLRIPERSGKSPALNIALQY